MCGGVGKDSALGPQPPPAEQERYRLGEALASGPHTSVRRALDLTTDTNVVVKIIRPGAEPFRELALRLFLKVGGVLGNRRPEAFPRLLDHGVSDRGEAFLVTEPVSGAPLQPAPAVTTLPLILPVTQSLEILARSGAPHLNLQPGNLLLTRLPTGDRLRVLGLGSGPLGLATAPPFAAPEQRRPGAAPDWRSDLWSLGRTLCELLTIPVSDDVRLQVPDAAVAGLVEPEALEDTLRSCLDPTPERRPTSFLELHDRLLEALFGADANQVASDHTQRIFIPRGIAGAASTSSPTQPEPGERAQPEPAAPDELPPVERTMRIPVGDLLEPPQPPPPAPTTPKPTPPEDADETPPAPATSEDEATRLLPLTELAPPAGGRPAPAAEAKTAGKKPPTPQARGTAPVVPAAAPPREPPRKQAPAPPPPPRPEQKSRPPKTSKTPPRPDTSKPAAQAHPPTPAPTPPDKARPERPPAAQPPAAQPPPAAAPPRAPAAGATRQSSQAPPAARPSRRGPRSGLSPRARAAVLGTAAVLALAAVSVTALLLLQHGRARRAPATPTVAALAFTPTPLPAEPTPEPLPAAFERAQQAFADGDYAAARRELAELAPAERDALPSSAAEQLTALEGALADQELQGLVAQLRHDLERGDLASLKVVVERLDRRFRGSVASSRSLRQRVAAARRAVESKQEMERAAADQDHVAVVRLAGEVLDAVPAASVAAREREAAAAAVEAEAQRLAGGGRLADAMARLEALRTAWPECPGLDERLDRLASARQGAERVEEAIRTAEAAERAQKPEEGLHALHAVAPVPSLSERYHQVEARLEQLLVHLDELPPVVQLATGDELEYRKDEPATVELKITDDYSIRTTAAFVRRKDASSYQRLDLTHTGDDLWTLTIPPSLHGNETVLFYVEAGDATGHTGRLGSAAQPLELRRHRWFR